MPVVTIIGAVVPPFGVTIDYPVEASGIITGVELEVSYKCYIKNDEVRVDCEVQTFDYDAHWRPLFQMVEGIASGVLNLMTFTTGYVAQVSLHDLIMPNGQRKRPRAIIGFAASLTKSLDTSPYDQLEAFQLLFQDSRRALALRDLVEAFIFPKNAHINCARAIEAIRRCLDQNPDRSHAWKIMRDTLNVSEAYIQAVMRPALEPRHGGWIVDQMTDSTDAVRRTWTIFDRYLTFLKRGGIDRLPLGQFPNLS